MNEYKYQCKYKIITSLWGVRGAKPHWRKKMYPQIKSYHQGQKYVHVFPWDRKHTVRPILSPFKKLEISENLRFQPGLTLGISAELINQLFYLLWLRPWKVYLRSVEIYDMESDSWASGPSTQLARAGSGIAWIQVDSDQLEKEPDRPLASAVLAVWPNILNFKSSLKAFKFQVVLLS